MATVVKPKTHIKELHSRYLNVIKLRSKPKNKVNACKEYLLTWLGRNICQCVDLVAKTLKLIPDFLRTAEAKWSPNG